MKNLASDMHLTREPANEDEPSGSEQSLLPARAISFHIGRSFITPEHSSKSTYGPKMLVLAEELLELAGVYAGNLLWVLKWRGINRR